MAFNKAPNAWIAGFDVKTSSGTGDITGLTNSTEYVVIPLASLPELTAVEAHNTTGDIRKILFALLEKMRTAWDLVAIADRPTKLTQSSSSSVSGNLITRTYNYSAIVEPSALDVVAES